MCGNGDMEETGEYIGMQEIHLHLKLEQAEKMCQAGPQRNRKVTP